MANAADIFGPQGYGSGVIAPQGQNEPLIFYGPRALAELPIRALTAGAQQLTGAGQMAADTYFTTPAQQQAAAKRQALVAPKNLVDPNAAIDTSIEGLTEGLINRGIPGHIARGVAAGLIGEGRGDPNAFNPTGGGQGAFGLAQWRGSRLQALRAKYGDKPSVGQQLDFIAYELKGGDPQAAAVMKARTPQEALASYVSNFARAGKDNADLYGRGFKALGYGEAQAQGQFSAPFVNPFDPTYANAAIGELNKAQAAAKTPFSISTDVGPMPEVPKPEPTPKTDFSASDAALEALRPVEVSLKEQNQIKWKNFWAGLGKAMASMPEGAGVGDFFLRLGGGALMGRAAGMEEIQSKQDEYENKLAKFQAAVYENNFQKAQINHQELLQDWQANQTWALQKYQQGLALWTRSATPQIVGNDIVFTKTTPDGKTSVQGIPINNMVDADFAMKRAQVYEGMFSANQSANAQVTGIENQIQGQIAIAKAGAILAGQGSDQEKAAAAAFAPVQAAGFAVDSGQVDAVIGPDESEKLTKSVQTTLTSRGLFPGTKDYSDAFSKMMTQQLAMAAFGNPQLMEKLSTLSPAAQLFENYGNYQDSKTQTQVTTDSRGRTTRRQTTTAPTSSIDNSGPTPLDIFAQSIQPDSSQPYSQYGYVRH